MGNCCGVRIHANTTDSYYNERMCVLYIKDDEMQISSTIVDGSRKRDFKEPSEYSNFTFDKIIVSTSEMPFGSHNLPEMKENRHIDSILLVAKGNVAQCAFEEREVVENRTVDDPPHYDKQLSLAMQYELKIVGFHHFDTMIVILSSPLCFRVLEDISDNILAIKMTNGILPSRKSDPKWLVKQRKDEVKTMRRWLR
ncbi:hypothetical protein Tco_1284398 [Tanacetum coccineum]